MLNTPTYQVLTKYTSLLNNTKKLFIPSITLSIILLVIGYYYSLVITPLDYQQKEIYKILYIHVPSAWLASVFYILLSLSSLIFLIKKHPLSYIFANNFAKVGLLFTFLTLLTGSLWGAPTWGTYWTWDARLTSVLILFFIYLGYVGLASVYSSTIKGATYTSIYALLGIINIPIIKFSVEWWNTLHQVSSISQSSVSIHSSMFFPLIFMFCIFLVYSSTLIILLVRIDLLQRRLNSLYMVLSKN